MKRGLEMVMRHQGRHLSLEAEGGEHGLSIDGSYRDPVGILRLSGLLDSLSANGILHPEAVKRGVSDIILELDSIAKENKAAPRLLARLLSHAIRDGYLKKVDIPKLPDAVAKYIKIDSPSSSPGHSP